mmetsp:Transcript_42003/g.164567  ORF Transcript_42003/g.164567 Transcript_42003/m.164567 type:complete len:215 (+) Transcript_42003:82-726(+)
MHVHKSYSLTRTSATSSSLSSTITFAGCSGPSMLSSTLNGQIRRSTKNETPSTTNDRYKNASLVGDTFLISRFRSTAPTFPPAPTIPEIPPVYLGSTNGTTPKVAPSAICTKIENRINIGIAAPSTVILENVKSISPSMTSVAKNTRSLPSIPHRFDPKSEVIPPSDRANRFIRPKSDAINPAVPSSSPNDVWKYDARFPFITSSTPKHVAYVK